MPWLIEDGIGETRALLVEGEQVLAARLYPTGELIAGTQVSGQLTAKLAGSRRGVVLIADSGGEALVDHLPSGVTEGQRLDLTVTRAALGERGRWKRAQTRVTEARPARPATGAAGESPWQSGRKVPRFPSGLWDEVWQAAAAASLDFPGGEILLSPTPAMTVIDIDGIGTPRAVALAAVPAIARALRWFDIGGNIGIDFPTLAAKEDRRALDTALTAALLDWPHERTAINGFGFVQIVARLTGPSLLHRFASDRRGMAARMALRRAELAAESGGTGRMVQLTVHPALEPRLRPAWLEALGRRTGRGLEIVRDPTLAIEAAYAQLVSA